MIVYAVCIAVALLALGIIFAGHKRKSELTMIAGLALYFIALFAAAIHSMPRL